MMKWTTTLIVLASVAAVPATKPAGPIDGFRGVIAAIPRDMWPTKQEWTKLQERVANDWAAFSLAGKRVRISGKLGDAAPGKTRGIFVLVEDQAIRIEGRAAMGWCQAEFPDSAADALRKFKVGDPIAFEGVLAKTIIRSEPAMKDDDGQAVSVLVYLKDTKIAK